ncbi:MAG: hypothetical protein ACLFUG_07045 [Nitriliruptoraceae bacterium]
MGYAVHHVDADGATHLEDHPTLDGALARVESLRNDGPASEVRVFKEIPIEVRTYYKVVAVEAAEEPTETADTAEEATATLPPPTEPVAHEARTHPVRLEPPPGAMLIGPAPSTAEPTAAPESREQAAHRGIFSRG